MSNVIRVDKENLSAELTLTITKDDYKAKLDSELKKFRKGSHLKGFRKGKTPMGVIRRMYGPKAFMDVINDLVQKRLFKYLEDEKIEILGQPIPSEDQEQFDFDIDRQQDYEFKFEIGMAPKFEVAGLSSDKKFNRFAVEVPASMIDKDVEMLTKRFGERTSVDTNIDENDVVTFNAEELDGDSIKENGWATTFDILIERVGDEALKEEIKSKKKGDKVRFNINHVEKDSSPEHVRKYLLNVGEGDEEVEIGEMFEATVEDVKRVVAAELNQELFDKAFGEGTITSEEEVRSKIEEDITRYYDNQAESLLFRDLQDYMLAENDLELPDNFLKKWLVASDEKNTKDLVEKEYEKFARNLQWSMIKGKLATQFELEVAEEEIFEGFKDRVRGYFQGYGNELIILNTANRLMEDQKQVNQMYEELMSEKLFQSIKGSVSIDDKKISTDDFDEEIKKAREEVMATQGEAPAPPTQDNPATEEEVTEDVEQ